MARDNELADEEPYDITRAVIDLWNKATENPNLTTSQKLQAVDPEMAKAYRLNKEIRDAVQEIRRMNLEDRQQRQKNDPWKFVRNIANYIVGEIDKRSK